MPCDPLGELRAWQAHLTRQHGDSWAPPIDVYETEQAYIITAEVPGLARDQVDVAVEDARLTIQGRRSVHPRAADAVHFHQVERSHGSFHRTFEFAEKIDAERVTADLTDGVLTISLPKAAPPPARRIEVR